MNENLQNAVTAMIERALSAVDTASTFLTAEIPDVVHQLLLWYGVRSFIFFLVGIGFLSTLVFMWFLTVKSIQKVKAEEDIPKYERTGKMADRFLISAFGSIPFTIATGVCLNLTWLQILIAPKVWLIEYSATLIK